MQLSAIGGQRMRSERIAKRAVENLNSWYWSSINSSPGTTHAQILPIILEVVT
jgi:hypothetical protein